MSDLAEHPTVQRYYARKDSMTPTSVHRSADWLRQLCLDADDVGFVSIDHPDIADQHDEIQRNFPFARTLIALVVRMSRENIRAPSRSIANLEFHHTNDFVNEVGRHIVARLEAEGLRAANGAAVGFPMETDRWGSKMWVLSHKPIAVAAGLGRMGIHRNVIHPKFGNFILLGTIVTEIEVSTYDGPIDYNPCLSCKLCVAACPTGAISPDGRFDFSACYTHNYREFLGGFTDWVETIAEAGSAKAYRQAVSDSETVSMWQSLSFGANYKAAYCIAVCPAGEDVIGPFLTDRAGFRDRIVQPLRDKAETIYVVANSDPETYVARYFPQKKIKRVRNGLGKPASIEAFLRGLPLVFQAGKSVGLAATYHFTFTGHEDTRVTIIIRAQRLEILTGHVGTPDLQVTVDSDTWLRFLRKETNIVFALLRRRIKLKGSPRLLLAFGHCFPS
ncbi:MAG: SCP2 sterol-binding domain-containing protein [Methylovirgula sp.]